MLTLIRNATVYSPEYLGVRDILVGGTQVAAVEEAGRIQVRGAEVEIVDGSGKTAVPGLIDPHVHILGGGGEGGPATRAPEIFIEDIVSSGVTTIIGCLGTDGVTRHMASLLAKARALETEGISTSIFSGSYEIPVQTITGSVRSDLALIDKVVGAGEIAVSDHRSSQPGFQEFARLAAECRVGGLLGGKAGVLHVHLGDGPRRLEMLFRLLRETEIPASQVVPTHVNRNRDLFEEAMDWVNAGGSIDLSTGPDPDPAGDPDVSLEEAVSAIIEKGLPVRRVMVSSDSNGSIPVFDGEGKLAGLSITSQRDFLRKFRDLVRKDVVGPEEASRLFSTNAADYYRFAAKGRIAPGKDADFLLLGKDFELRDVFAKGRPLMRNGLLLVQRTVNAP